MMSGKRCLAEDQLEAWGLCTAWLSSSSPANETAEFCSVSPPPTPLPAAPPPAGPLRLRRCARASPVPPAHSCSFKILCPSINKSRVFLLQIPQVWASFFEPTLSVSLSGDHVVDDPRAAVCVVVEGRVRVVEGWGGVLLLLDVAWQQVREAAIKQTTIRTQEVKE